MSGPFQGLVGLATPYQMTVTARLPDGSEASLTRTLQTVAIPGVPVRHLLRERSELLRRPELQLRRPRAHQLQPVPRERRRQHADAGGPVTTVGEIIRTNLSNGWDTNTNYNGTVNAHHRARRVPRAGDDRGQPRRHARLGARTSRRGRTCRPAPTTTTSRTAARARRRLDLPVTSFGAQPIDLIRRPRPNENVANPQRAAPSASTRWPACGFCCRTRRRTSPACRA